MKPRVTPTDDPADLFRARLSQIMDLSHPLVRLADRIDWQQVHERVGVFYADEGRPGVSARLMVGLHYLKHAFDVSDESVCERWVENPYWQYFCGETYLQHDLPADGSTLTRWRQRVGEDIFSDLLKLTLNLAVGLNQVKPSAFEEVVVDTTVQPKAIAHPTDARLYDKARRVLVQVAQREGIALRQTYARVGRRALLKCGRYAHARQFKRARRERRKLRTWLGRVLRELRRHEARHASLDAKAAELLQRCERLHQQQWDDADKLYSLHAPEVVCISKGKARQRYEFGSKVSVVTSLIGNWVLSCRSLLGNPYDGHTLTMSLCDASVRTGRKVKRAWTDRGYRGHDAGRGPGELGVDVISPHDRQRLKQSRTLRRKLNRRQSIEPVIGHLKHDHRMGRCHLKGRLGDQLNALGAALGFNLRKLLAGLRQHWPSPRMVGASG
ncbi:MAG: IS5 family transposase [Candidatus Competibacteraceae bacterium]|nr:IS5 family transposase [Candidatus Competibacteraceae bacterium]